MRAEETGLLETPVKEGLRILARIIARQLLSEGDVDESNHKKDGHEKEV